MRRKAYVVNGESPTYSGNLL